MVEDLGEPGVPALRQAPRLLGGRPLRRIVVHVEVIGLEDLEIEAAVLDLVAPEVLGCGGGRYGDAGGGGEQRGERKLPCAETRIFHGALHVVSILHQPAADASGGRRSLLRTRRCRGTANPCRRSLRFAPGLRPGVNPPGRADGDARQYGEEAVRAGSCAAQAATRPAPAEAGHRPAPAQGRFTGPRPSREFTRAGRGPRPYTTFPIGSFLIRFPVAAKIALHTAGAIGPTDGSPMPPCLSVLGTTCTSTLGISARRNMG